MPGQEIFGPIEHYTLPGGQVVLSVTTVDPATGMSGATQANSNAGGTVITTITKQPTSPLVSPPPVSPTNISVPQMNVANKIYAPLPRKVTANGLYTSGDTMTEYRSDTWVNYALSFVNKLVSTLTITYPYSGSYSWAGNVLTMTGIQSEGFIRNTTVSNYYNSVPNVTRWDFILSGEVAQLTELGLRAYGSANTYKWAPYLGGTLTDNGNGTYTASVYADGGVNGYSLNAVDIQVSGVNTIIVHEIRMFG